MEVIIDMAFSPSGIPLRNEDMTFEERTTAWIGVIALGRYWRTSDGKIQGEAAGRVVAHESFAAWANRVWNLPGSRYHWQVYKYGSKWIVKTPFEERDVLKLVAVTAEWNAQLSSWLVSNEDLPVLEWMVGRSIASQ